MAGATLLVVDAVPSVVMNGNTRGRSAGPQARLSHTAARRKLGALVLAAVLAVFGPDTTWAGSGEGNAAGRNSATVGNGTDPRLFSRPNSPYRIFILGVRLERGWGVEKDLSRAVRLYLGLVNEGYDYAAVRLGNLYLTGRGVPRDVEEAHHLFKRAAIYFETYKKSLDSPRFKPLLGDLADNEELRRAFDWARTVMSWSGAALLALSDRYRDGQDLPRDRKMAFHLLSAAAEKELPEAKYRFGMVFITGQFGPGTETNPKAGITWLLIAASRGHVKAQTTLASIYARGEVTERNYAKAYGWLLIARRNGADVAADLGWLDAVISPDDRKRALLFLDHRWAPWLP